MSRFGVSIVEAGDQGYQDIANPPPPPLPQVSTADDWSNPYANAPPLVTAVPANEPSNWDTWFGRGKQVVTGLVDIFGRQVTPTGQPIQPQPQGMPLWGWALVGVGGVVLLGVTARALRRPALAGYRRRRSRR